jgi:hypothetical protein
MQNVDSKGLPVAGTQTWFDAHPAGDWKLGAQAMARFANVGGAATTEASAWQLPPLAADPSTMIAAPVPHAVICDITLALQVPGVRVTADPQPDAQPLVPNCTVAVPHVAPVTGPHEQLQVAGLPDGEVPPSKTSI